MQKNIAEGGERHGAKRPSGHGDALVQFARDNGGSIPGNLINAPNGISNDIYMRQCRAAGLPIHPARFPEALPSMFIQLLTEPGDTVYDPFGGSNTVGYLCELLGRRWITSERALTYIKGSKFRFSPETLTEAHIGFHPVMTIDTKTLLFGAHQFLLHPIFVAAAWCKLYGAPLDPRLWMAFFLHDVGYFGKENLTKHI